MSSKEERMKSINLIINEIAKRGRRFFYNKDNQNVSHFHFKGEKQKRLWFRDKIGEDVSPYPSNYHSDFNISEGGTLWALVHDFREFILTGKHSNGSNGYAGLYSPHWGYSEEDMNEIIKLAKKVGFLEVN